MAKTREQKRLEARDRLAASVVEDHHWLRTVRDPEQPVVQATRAIDIQRALARHEAQLRTHRRDVALVQSRYYTNQSRLIDLNQQCGLPQFVLDRANPHTNLTGFVFPEKTP